MKYKFKNGDTIKLQTAWTTMPTIERSWPNPMHWTQKIWYDNEINDMQNHIDQTKQDFREFSNNVKSNNLFDYNYSNSFKSALDGAMYNYRLKNIEKLASDNAETELKEKWKPYGLFYEKDASDRFYDAKEAAGLQAKYTVEELAKDLANGRELNEYEQKDIQDRANSAYLEASNNTKKLLNGVGTASLLTGITIPALGNSLITGISTKGALGGVSRFIGGWAGSDVLGYGGSRAGKWLDKKFDTGHKFETGLGIAAAIPGWTIGERLGYSLGKGILRNQLRNSFRKYGADTIKSRWASDAMKWDVVYDAMKKGWTYTPKTYNTLQLNDAEFQPQLETIPSFKQSYSTPYTGTAQFRTAYATNSGNNWDSWYGIDPQTLTNQHIGINGIRGPKQTFNYMTPAEKQPTSAFNAFLNRSINERDDIVRYWNGEKYSSYDQLKRNPIDHAAFVKWLNLFNKKKK